MSIDSPASQPKTDNGTLDSMYNWSPIWNNYLMESNENLIQEKLNTLSSAALKLEPKNFKTTLGLNTFTVPSSTTIEFPNERCLKISTSKQEMVIISFQEIEVCLTPDGKTITRKSTVKSTHQNSCCVRWETYQPTETLMDKISL